ncbi:hypothetical protein [Methylococcus capsulatus]|uniref:hypothetical protein n=1 Tax=Methylococcus capsulatus TaxID=414 RepID=UPI001C52B705|nr:hypothetical protein [Methylococcus capsulatus]QXP89106.1 hypothetical protein KW114_08125 [Methylococcus capsulatus]
MAKTYLLIPLDTGLVSQIKEVLPNTSFESVEAAIADLVADGITLSHSVWTRRISWEPSESEEEPSTFCKPDISNIPRNLAHELNPLIGAATGADTLDHCAELSGFLVDVLSSTRDEPITGAKHSYMLCWAVAAALKYEYAVACGRGKSE